MSTTAALPKKKCEFWDKCYRKNKQHKEEYLHPCDMQDDEKIETKKTTKLDEKDEEKITVDYSKKKNDGVSKAAVATNAADSGASTKAAEAGVGATCSNKDTSAAPQVIQYVSKKEKCKYWEKCYQTSKAHKDEFYHPGDDIPANDDGKQKENKKTRAQTNRPQNDIPDGASVQFDSGYTLKRDGDIYSCTCKGFLIQKAPINERTCKHLKEYLGDHFEKIRVEKNTKPKKVHISSHININLLLAHKYDEKATDPKGWWISEKLDGVRAFWNGRCFYSRLGNAFYAPEWFTRDLPKDIHLDGELFGGRGQFQSTVSIVKTAESPKWKDIKYYVFDAPHMGKETFEKRMNVIKEYFEEHEPKYAVFVEQTKCKSKEHLEGKLTRVLNIGGEGLMIRQPNSIYEPTRSKTLLKIKKFYDAEAIVIAHERGKGVNQHRCGALRCRMACGKEFSVGSGMTDKNRNNPPKIGSIITYRFQELSNSGSPRFPTFVGIRLDKTEPEDAEIRPVLNEEDA
ncbi:hypothetical protein EGW08_001734 [Elysia chlorotica]|uniref:ATP-dependent DNA ligase family profile domain-containing protein n=1 Tax=Elysia chlorotica TaxID=188477 RepID=A0A3S1BSS9_ELYCH|nr:hypothetical protein EGW08_001734 [Elysia chlorotica]